MRRKSPPRLTRQIPLFPPAGHELRVELAAPQQRESIRALAEVDLTYSSRSSTVPLLLSISRADERSPSNLEAHTCQTIFLLLKANFTTC